MHHAVTRRRLAKTQFALTPLALAIAAAGVSAQTQTPVAPAAPAASAVPPAAPVAPASPSQAAPMDRTLPSVIVYGQPEAIGGLQKTYSGGQLARGGNLGLLGVTDLMNVPVSTTNYTSELIENQQARSVADVVMNDASVRPLTARGGFGDDFQIRGFQVGNSDIALNGLLGITPSTRIPLETIERVEVLKGPGSLAIGVGPGGAVGGSINVVPKRADDIPLTRLTTTYGTKAQVGTHLDLGRRYGEDNQIGVRFNGVLRGGEANIDDGKENLALGSLGLDYAGDRTRVSVDLMASNGETDEFRPQTSFAAAATTVPAVPDARKSFYPGQSLVEKTRTVMSRIEHDLSDRTMVYAGAGYTFNTYKQNLATTTAPTGIDSQGNMNVANAWYDQNQESSAADAGLRTRFETGSVKHTLVLGFNYVEQKTQYFYTQTAGVPSNIYNPVPLPDITAFRDDPKKSGEIRQYSTAIADTLALLDDKLMLTLGLRKQTLAQETFNVANGATTANYKSDAVTPLLGIVVKPVTNVSLYANHTSGLTRGAVAAPARSNAGETFPPQKSKQTEVGVKVDWGQITTQAALYQIERPSSYTDAVTNALVFGGEQRNRGLELTAYGELQRGLRVMASAAFQDAVYTRTGGASSAFQGNDARGVPDRNYNLGLDWDTPWVPGLSVNGRVIYTSSVYANEANTQKVDDWSRLDIGARYKTKVNGKPVTFRANLENVTDEQYWVVSNYVTVGAPRTLMLSAAVDF